MSRMHYKMIHYYRKKHDRLKTLKRLRNDEQLLCERLIMPQHDLNFVGCPTLEQLRELEQNVKFLKEDKVSILVVNNPIPP